MDKGLQQKVKEAVTEGSTGSWSTGEQKGESLVISRKSHEKAS